MVPFNESHKAISLYVHLDAIWRKLKKNRAYYLYKRNFLKIMGIKLVIRKFELIFEIVEIPPILTGQIWDYKNPSLEIVRFNFMGIKKIEHILSKLN